MDLSFRGCHLTHYSYYWNFGSDTICWRCKELRDFLEQLRSRRRGTKLWAGTKLPVSGARVHEWWGHGLSWCSTSSDVSEVRNTQKTHLGEKIKSKKINKRRDPTASVYGGCSQPWGRNLKTYPQRPPFLVWPMSTLMTCFPVSCPQWDRLCYRWRVPHLWIYTSRNCVVICLECHRGNALNVKFPSSSEILGIFLRRPSDIFVHKDIYHNTVYNTKRAEATYVSFNLRFIK